MKTLLFILLFGFIPCAQALNKCIDANGQTSYSDTPCQQTSPSKIAPQPTPVPVNKNESHSGILGSAFEKYSNALKSGNWEAYLDSVSARLRAKLELVGEKGLQMTKAMSPSSITIVDETIAASGDTGTLHVKGMAPSFGSASEKMNYGTISLIKESGVWKIDQQSWSDSGWRPSNQIHQDIQKQQQSSCAGVTGKPESLSDQSMLKLLPGETQVAKFELTPSGGKEIRLPSNGAEQITFRVALNSALKCKYGDNPPVGMSVDGGKVWLYSYYASQQVFPSNGTINLIFKNSGQEAMNLLVVSSLPKAQ